MKVPKPAHLVPAGVGGSTRHLEGRTSCKDLAAAQENSDRSRCGSPLHSVVEDKRNRAPVDKGQRLAGADTDQDMALGKEHQPVAEDRAAAAVQCL
jgi:hypothetical protein